MKLGVFFTSVLLVLSPIAISNSPVAISDDPVPPTSRTTNADGVGEDVRADGKTQADEATEAGGRARANEDAWTNRSTRTYEGAQPNETTQTGTDARPGEGTRTDGGPRIGASGTGHSAMSSSANRTATAPSTDDFDWPTSSTTVLRDFDHLENNWDSGHRGVDLASKPDEEIRAAGPGRVVYAGRVVDNNVISIEHATGLRTTYLPVTASVSVGDYVSTGDVIGTIEEGHCLLGACLHWGAKRGDRYYDPLSLLDSVEIRLYPVGK